MKQTYLALMVPVRMNTIWFRNLKRALAAAAIPAKWQSEKTHHQTLVFINDDNCIDSLKQAFSELISSKSPIPLTIDKLEAFTTGKGDEHVVCLTSTHPSTEIIQLADDARSSADRIGASRDKRPFKLHITLCRIPVNAISLEALQTILSKISLPTFDCCLDDAQYKYKGSGRVIGRWNL